MDIRSHSKDSGPDIDIMGLSHVFGKVASPRLPRDGEVAFGSIAVLAKTTIMLVAVTLALATVNPARAAEIKIRSHAQCTGHIITLGDLADISSPSVLEKSKLEKLELFPSPTHGQSKRITARLIREMIDLQGWQGSIEIIGAAEVRIQRASSASVGKRTAPGTRYTKALARQADQRVERAILSYLESVDSEEKWSVNVQLPAGAAERIPAQWQSIRVQGGRPPLTGRQSFHVEFTRNGYPEQVAVAAEVSLPPRVVVARSRIRTGQILHVRDVELVRSTRTRSDGEYLLELADAVGMQASRSLVPGQPIEARHVQTIRRVKRRDVVTVVARVGGLVVRTQGVAQQDGGVDDVIQVQSLNSKEKFAARVVGSKTVELFAAGPSYASARRQASESPGRTLEAVRVPQLRRFSRQSPRR